MSREYHWLSTCHDAEIKVVGGSDGGDTQHAECTVCGRSCNIYDKNTADSFRPMIMDKQYLLVKTLSVGDQLVLQRVGMFASKEEAQDYVEHGEDYYLIRAEQLFWNVTIPDGKFYTGAGKRNKTGKDK